MTKYRHWFRSPFVIGLIAVIGLLSITLSTVAWAGCGCSKPPPLPGSVIPSFGVPGMQLTFFGPQLSVGQTWNVTFSGGGSSYTSTGAVVLKRAITDPSGLTWSPQLAITAPDELPPGPVSIALASGSLTMAIPSSSFTMLGRPATAASLVASTNLDPFTSAVGSDGTFYLALGGLQAVCDPVQITAYFDNYPLTFATGDVQIFNWQGYYIDALNSTSQNHFQVQPPSDDSGSDGLFYSRHSFENYCAQHMPGQPKQIDPSDPNWHIDGTPHVDYSVVVFAIKGQVNGAAIAPGSAIGSLNIMTQPSTSLTGSWQTETGEESLTP
ncbi:MAG TPA: hypothetical protein VKS22_16925 [Candidatus Binataceae bacterium]|nr:hypothetical protein [Candidatus Binataceae bacterium]